MEDRDTKHNVCLCFRLLGGEGAGCGRAEEEKHTKRETSDFECFYAGVRL